MVRRSSHSERRKPQFTSSSASYAMARAPERAMVPKLGAAFGRSKKNNPTLVLSFSQDMYVSQRYVWEVDEVKINISPDRKNKKHYFAGLYFDEVFLFGANGFQPFDTLKSLFGKQKWLYLGVNWYDLYWCYRGIVIQGISGETTDLGPATTVVKFDRSHLDIKALWRWESGIIEHKRSQGEQNKKSSPRTGDR